MTKRKRNNETRALVLEFLDGYEKLLRKDCDEIAWIALKLSLAYQEADELIRWARKFQDSPPSPPTA